VQPGSVQRSYRSTQPRNNKLQTQYSAKAAFPSTEGGLFIFELQGKMELAIFRATVDY
jgi:hypothetical protein